MVIYAGYWALLICNAVVIVASLAYGPRMRRVCRGAGLVSGLALMVFVVPLVRLIITADPPHDRWFGVKVIAVSAAPLAAEFAALVVLWRRMEQA